MAKKWSEKKHEGINPAMIIILIMLSVCFLQIENLFAAFSFNATPYEGGLDLRFENVQSGTKTAKEVAINITSDIGKQYRLIQTSVPLTNSRGAVISPQAFTLYTLRGSSARGTLGYDFETSVISGPMTIYTSDGSGQSNSFVVVYGLNLPIDQEPGQYRGRLIFSLEPVGSSSQSPVVKTLDVTVEVEAVANFEVTTSMGSKILSLESPSTEQSRRQEVKIKIGGFLGRGYRIIQRTAQPLRDTAGRQLPEKIILMSGRGGSNGQLGIGDSVALPLGDMVLYTSDNRGSPDEIVITYALSDASKDLTAGNYRGTLAYLVESAMPMQQGGNLDILQLEVEIKSIFNLSVNSDETGRIAFKDLKPLQPPKIRTSYIEVQTNTGQSYQVVQRVAGPLTNEDGKTIPYGFFKLKTEAEQDTKGLNYTGEAPVETGQMVLYTSKEGKPVKFNVIYKLGVPQDIASGNYSTSITYSLLEQ
ncbi:MAG: hypothetical protein FJZ10_06215 [Candidatus Omnitrophica bacterium]|nr:hypothetical protein [Candidatus Omnitrophota bacterium]